MIGLVVYYQGQDFNRGRIWNFFQGNDKSKLLLNAVVLFNCSYCRLIWLFCCKTANNDINRTHMRALRILYESTFEELLDRVNTKTTHTKNLQKLMIKYINRSFTETQSICGNLP